MPEQRDIFLINATDTPGLVQQLNFILARIADRLDRAEGLRENPKYYAAEFEFDTGSSITGALRAASDGDSATFASTDGDSLAPQDAPADATGVSTALSHQDCGVVAADGTIYDFADLRTEINTIKTTVNTLIDTLQTANVLNS